MACPVCDHTMQNIKSESTFRLFWCSRCGTLKEECVDLDTKSGEHIVTFTNIESPIWIRNIIGAAKCGPGNEGYDEDTVVVEFKAERNNDISGVGGVKKLSLLHIGELG